MRVARGDALLTVATSLGRSLTCRVDGSRCYRVQAKGVQMLKLGEGDRMIGFAVGETLKVETDKGATHELGGSAADVTARGGKGRGVKEKANLCAACLLRRRCRS